MLDLMPISYLELNRWCGRFVFYPGLRIQDSMSVQVLSRCCQASLHANSEGCYCWACGMILIAFNTSYGALKEEC